MLCTQCLLHFERVALGYPNHLCSNPHLPRICDLFHLWPYHWDCYGHLRPDNVTASFSRNHPGVLTLLESVWRVWISHVFAFGGTFKPVSHTKSDIKNKRGDIETALHGKWDSFHYCIFSDVKWGSSNRDFEIFRVWTNFNDGKDGTSTHFDDFLSLDSANHLNDYREICWWFWIQKFEGSQRYCFHDVLRKRKGTLLKNWMVCVFLLAFHS